MAGMAGMQPMAGGPNPMMNDPSAFGGGASTIARDSRKDPKAMLPTFIYDYFRRNGNIEIAQAMLNESQELQIMFKDNNAKAAPGRREVNGVDDGKDGEKNEELQRKIDNLPPAAVPDLAQDHSFLKDWWCQFWDLYTAGSNPNKNASNVAQYLQHAQNQQRMRQMPQQNMMNPAMQGGMYNPQMARLQQQQNTGLAKQAATNSSRANMNQFQMRNMQQQMGQNMQRDGSDMDMNGQGRPQSPMSGDGAPSPSKKQRIDGGGFNGPQGPRAASLGQIPNGAGQAMMMNIMDPGIMSQFNGMNGGSQLANYRQGLANTQRDAMEGVSGAKPGLQRSPVMGGPEGQMQIAGEFFGGPPGGQMGRNGGNAPPHTGGALADYQMQLMLLEQQNKKRLMMARQEQDVASRDGQVPPGPGGKQQGGTMLNQAGQPFAPRMSPHGSRTGQSPNPNDQMKRGTPKIGQGSPLPDGSMPATRGSPAPGFDPGVQANMGQQQFMNQMQKGEGLIMGPNGQVMRAPGSNPGFPPNGNMTQQQMEIIARQNGGRMPNGTWPQGQMPQQMMQQQQGQMPQQGQPENQQQRNQMPPPQAPPGGNGQRGTNPSSPQQQSAAPPTPSQTNKAAPKKKDTKDTKKKAANKKNQTNAAATPSSEAEQNPPTPTPATPITPVHPQSFSTTKGSGPPQTNNQQQPPAVGGQQGGVGVPPQPDAGGNGGQGPFGSIEGAGDMPFQMGNMDFGTMESGDVLGDFDFDSFLQMDNDTGFEFNPDQFVGNGEGVETGPGEV